MSFLKNVKSMAFDLVYAFVVIGTMCAFAENRSAAVYVPVKDGTYVNGLTNVQTADTAYQDVANLPFDSYNINMYEGCTDSFVYPGGKSGPTIACGFDLANFGSHNVDSVLFTAVNKGVITQHTANKLKRAKSYRGAKAKNFIKHNQVHIGLEESENLCNVLKEYVWKIMVYEWPHIDNAPESVQQSLLSAVFNLGINNHKFDGMDKLLETHQYTKIANKISGMSINFKKTSLKSLHNRRQVEAFNIHVDMQPGKYKTEDIDYD